MYKIITIELEMSFVQAERYAAIHLDALSDARRSSVPSEEIPTTTRIGMSVHRRLCFAAFHSGLDNFFKSSKVTTAKVADWSDRKDYGHKLTRIDVLAPAHRSRISAAISICNPSVKLQWLCGLVKDVCMDNKRNLIVFCSWPTTQWLVELLFFIIGVPTMSIRAAHAATTRAETHEAFKDPTTQGTVLVKLTARRNFNERTEEVLRSSVEPHEETEDGVQLFESTQMWHTLLRHPGVTEYTSTLWNNQDKMLPVKARNRNKITININ